ncbi:Six-hairpin glycosidase-like protein [Clohesyomyces aquaticus]|uniref:Six-hairpin glycosidase-like protein n=1 Tax=Clohesyomyces aquaticus TaxID=1231657 RepID=A0A1Y2A0T0_9PLEO|nr:Six-hairpin glycosidase-like protein [Clohesyomyces aquaticus]
MLLSKSWNSALLYASLAQCKIDRESIVRQFNLRLNQSNEYSPVQVGNGNFAFGVDVTGLQTFLPHNTLSSWGWHNSSFPTTPNQTSAGDFTGVDWLTHDRTVNYEQPNPAEKDISQWMISNPHRINLGRIGLWFRGRNISEVNLEEKTQVLDLWEGVISSSFTLNGTKVQVVTVVSLETDTVAVQITSDLLGLGDLGVFFDFPYASGKNKFDAPFVGVWNATANHTTTLTKRNNGATIKHVLDATSYVTNITWESEASMDGPVPGTHRYVLKCSTGVSLSITATFAPVEQVGVGSFEEVRIKGAEWWKDYWETGGFVSLPLSNTSAKELQRRIILSQYLLAVNGAGQDPPQESGLVNNGWYGKFHLEMVFWHLMHWTIWNRWSLYDRSIGVYGRFLPTSFDRAKRQGYQGARLGKMSDPSGRSAPGEINSLLIWQQPHPMYFAEMEYRKFPTLKTLEKWDQVLTATADFMASFAYFNESTHVYDLGPPMYPVSENTNPNQTINPTFELAYWRFGLKVAEKWRLRQGKSIPSSWLHVRDKLAPFPVQEGVYVLYEGVKDMWTAPSLAEDHPGLIGIHGWLPPDSRLNATTFRKTVDKVYSSWNFTYSYGWDFPLLAMTAARLGDSERAVHWLLDANNKFDEVGMPIGGARVATPYFPASSGLLLAVGMMAGGWDEVEGPVFPWDVEVEGFSKAM